MNHAIVVAETGGPEVLRWKEVEVGAPGPGEVLIRHTAVGLNFIDVYFRTGLYPPPSMPFIPGMEGAGVVETAGEGVPTLAPGDRVAYAAAPPGAYCERRLIAADRLIRLPEGIDDETAAAMMLKGMTAWYLLRRTYAVQPGDTILLHAAAGGVGLIACQWAAALGATVIGTVGSTEKAELARRFGCAHPVNYRNEDVVARVREITGGRGVTVVYDSVGRDTFSTSLDCLATRGLLVSFGQSSGPVPPLDTGELARRGSLYLTRPTLFHYIAEREELESAAGELFDMVASGQVRIPVNHRYPLAEAAEAHRALEARETTGSTVLVP